MGLVCEVLRRRSRRSRQPRQSFREDCGPQARKTAAGEFPHYALPRAVVLTQEPWTIENGLITPTLKLKRGPLSKKFANVIAQLYATHG